LYYQYLKVSVVLWFFGGLIAKQRQFCKAIGIKPDVKIKKFDSELLEKGL